MKYLSYSVLITFLCVFAAKVDADQYLIDDPVCFNIINEEQQTVIGHVETARHPVSGNRHRSEFRLESGERTQACTVGPFYADYRVGFVIKTFLPLFSCKTKVNEDIIIKRQRIGRDTYKKNVRGETIWAECH